MNHTDELTDRFIDGTLTDAEALELEALPASWCGMFHRDRSKR